LSRFSEADSLKYARRPKPINISKVKDCITNVLKEQLKLDEKGCPTLDEETSTDMMKLMVDMFRELDENTLRYLTLAITLVATLHVTVDMRLFLDSGKLGSITNPRIICHGKKWVHADHIPGISCNVPEYQPEDIENEVDGEEEVVAENEGVAEKEVVGETEGVAEKEGVGETEVVAEKEVVEEDSGPLPKKRKAVPRSSLRTRADAALAELSDSEGEEDGKGNQEFMDAES